MIIFKQDLLIYLFFTDIYLRLFLSLLYFYFYNYIISLFIY